MKSHFSELSSETPMMLVQTIEIEMLDEMSHDIDNTEDRLIGSALVFWHIHTCLIPFISRIMYKCYFNICNGIRNRPPLRDYEILLNF